MQRIHTNDSIVGWSMGALCVGLGVVYTIFFSLGSPLESNALQGGDQHVEEIQMPAEQGVSNQGGSSDLPTQPTVPVQDDEPIGAELPEGSMQGGGFEDQESEQPQRSEQEIISRPVLPETPFHIVSTQALFFPQSNRPDPPLSQTYEPTEILYLAGTHHRKGVMRSADILGFNDQILYILKNNDNTHFAYLGKELPDITQKLSELEGKTLAITHKNDINVHGLFGDNVIYLLVPQYIGKKALFFVQFAEAKDRWFLQVDSDIFETTKPLLRELFTKRYNR